MTVVKLYLASDELSCTALVTETVDLGARQVLRLDRTLMHPRGGGQKEDKGTINGILVEDVRHADGGEVDHVVGGAGFVAGQSVHLAVDPVWRDETRRWHSAGHLIADCVSALDPGLRAVRGHHWPGEGRVEFVGDAIDLGTLSQQLAACLQDSIGRDIPFHIVGDPHRSRAIQIGSHMPVPCGGTHVRSAGALSGLVLRKIQQKEGLLRIGYSFEPTLPKQ